MGHPALSTLGDYNLPPPFFKVLFHFASVCFSVAASDFSRVDFARVMVDKSGSAHSLTHPSLGKMTRRGNSQQKKELETMFPDTELIVMNIGKIPEMELRIAIIKLIDRLEKCINDSTESLRVEMRLNHVEI